MWATSSGVRSVRGDVDNGWLMATVDDMDQGWSGPAPLPDVNNSACEWLGEILRRAGAPGSIAAGLEDLYPRRPGPGRPYRPDAVRIYLGWRAVSLQARLTEDQIVIVLSNRFGVPITKRELSRNREELRRFAATLRAAPWDPLQVDQPLDEMPAPIESTIRNARIGRLRRNKNAFAAIRPRLVRLYDKTLRESQAEGDQRMRELEQRAVADERLMAAARSWEVATGGAHEDLIVACIAAYELELNRAAS